MSESELDYTAFNYSAAQQALNAAGIAKKKILEMDKSLDVANETNAIALIAKQNAIDAVNEASSAVGQASLAIESMNATKNSITQSANNAIGQALTAAENTINATQDANTAAHTANTAAQNANENAALANTEAGKANSAATAADQAAEDARQAAKTANAARGWSPVLAIDSQTIPNKSLMIIEDWTGGTGTKPTKGTGQWLKVGGGFTGDPMEAENLKGAEGGISLLEFQVNEEMELLQHYEGIDLDFAISPDGDLTLTF